MYYQEKRNVVGMATIFCLTAGYGVYALNRFRAGVIGPEDAKSWALAMLIFVGAGVLAAILIQILFHILLAVSIAARQRGGKKAEIEESIEATMVEDEMDRLVELKSSRAGYACAGFGFLAALAATALGASTIVMINIQFFAFAAGAMVAGFVQLRLYRKGIRNG